MIYIEIECSINPYSEENSEILVALMSDQGFDFFEEVDDKLMAYVSKSSYDKNAVLNIIESVGFNVSIKEREIEEQNWNAVWESSFQPVQIDDFCYVRASFHESNTHVKHEILIDPKMSFGTGHHATTYLMIKQMQTLDFQNMQVLDMGCGTGVLAILASQLGAVKITAIDNDQWAVDNAIENLELNKILNVEARMGDFNSLAVGVYDIILANITRNVLIQHMDQISIALKDNGQVLFSGFYETDLEIITKESALNNLYYSSHTTHEGWCVALFKKKKVK